MKHREIERKFLVRDHTWRERGQGLRCRQGYVVFGPPVSVRVRVLGEQGYLTLKRAVESAPGSGAAIERTEFEYGIPRDEAEHMLETLCSGTIDKTRYRVEHAGRTWEIDEFHGANEGLVVAEVELESADAPIDKAPWVGEDVSRDPRYLNVNLARHPYRDWCTS